MLLHTREAAERIYHPELDMTTLRTIQFAGATSPATGGTSEDSDMTA